MLRLDFKGWLFVYLGSSYLGVFSLPYRCIHSLRTSGAIFLVVQHVPEPHSALFFRRTFSLMLLFSHICLSSAIFIFKSMLKIYLQCFCKHSLGRLGLMALVLGQNHSEEWEILPQMKEEWKKWWQKHHSSNESIIHKSHQQLLEKIT